MGHGIHEDAPAVGAYVLPSTHGIGAVEPAGQALPAGHGVRTPPGQYDPAGQEIHLCKSAEGYDPMQGVGLIEFTGHIVPAGHIIEEVPPGQYEPTEQFVHDVEPEFDVFPGGHAMHEVALCIPLYVPGRQGVHDASPDKANFPEPQGAHPEPVLIVPPGHVIHDVA